MDELKKTKELVEKYLKKKYPDAQFRDEDLEFLARFSVKKEPKESEILKELGLISGKGTVQGYYADHESVKNAKDCIQAIYERFNTKRNSQKEKEHPVDVFGDDFEAFFAWWCDKTPEDGIRRCCYCEVDEKALNDFYKSKFNDYEDPLFSMFIKVDGMISYSALLFIPSHAPYNLYSDNYEKGLQLYAKNIFIKDFDSMRKPCVQGDARG